MSKPVRHYDKWRIRWTDASGKRQSRTFDDFRTADVALKREILAAEEERSGLRPPRAPERTFLEATTYWEKNRLPHKRSAKDDTSILKQLKAHFANVKLDDGGGWVTAIDGYRAAKAHLSKKTLANHLVLLGSVLRVAHDLGWMSRVPPIKKPRVRLISRDYSYLRNDSEIARFLTSARAEGELVYTLYATALYTGARAGELAALEWTDVDFDSRLIVIQRSFDGPTKAEDVRYVPILDPLLPVLRHWKNTHPGRLLFTNRDGAMLQPSTRVFQDVLKRVLARAEFPLVQRGGKQRPYIRFHDLRHSFASLWVANNGELFKLQRILGHKSTALTLRYAHLQPSAFREDFDRLGKAPLVD